MKTPMIDKVFNDYNSMVCSGCGDNQCNHCDVDEDITEAQQELQKLIDIIDMLRDAIDKHSKVSGNKAMASNVQLYKVLDSLE